MTSKPNRLAEAAELRRRAEDYAAQAGSSLPAPLEPEDTQRTLHELRVYQVELEMQNSELCRSRAGLEAAQARHFDFYNRAPVGYVSLSEAGLILEANLPFANLVGVAPGALVKEPLTRFVLKEDRDTLYFLGKRLAATGGVPGVRSADGKRRRDAVLGAAEGRRRRGCRGQACFPDRPERHHRQEARRRKSGGGPAGL